MRFWRNHAPIQHPEWILDALGSLSRTAALYSTRRLPGSIEVPMIVVPIKRALRGVYGSDLRAALALLWMALGDEIDSAGARLQGFWLFTILRKDREAYIEAKLAELEREDQRTA